MIILLLQLQSSPAAVVSTAIPLPFKAPSAAMQSLGGKVETVEADGEYGRTSIRTTQASELYQEETDHAQSVWMSHGDKVAELPEGFHPVATSEKVLKFYHLQ